MDLSTIVNEDDQGSTGKPPLASRHPLGGSSRPSVGVASPSFEPSSQLPYAYGDPMRTSVRPPPSPVPPRPLQSDLRSYSASSHASLAQRSPTQTPSSLPAGGSYPFPQRLSHSPSVTNRPTPNGVRESLPPMTPGIGQAPNISSYVQEGAPASFSTPSHHYRPPSRSYQPPQYQPTPSPTATMAQAPGPQGARESPRSGSTLSHHSQLPPIPQASHPPTPLGPPPNYQRTPSYGSRDFVSPSTTHQRSYSSVSHGAAHSTHSVSPPAPHPACLTGPPSESPRPFERTPIPYPQHKGAHAPQLGRERTESVSPKTQVLKTPQASQNFAQRPNSQSSWSAQASPPRTEEGTGQKRPAESISDLATAPPLRPTKRQRYAQVPPWAQRAPESAEMKRRIAAGEAPRQRRQQQPKQHNFSIPSRQQNGDATGMTPPVQKTRPDFEETNDGPLGYWEASITNVIPYDELTRVVTDFMFFNVVQSDEAAVGELGTPALPAGTLEVEAKLGTFIDKDTESRLELPVTTTTVLSDQFRQRVRFESNMTEHQHKALNDFLNQTLQQSHGPQEPGKRKRVPLSYVHHYERDSFLELSQAGYSMLPPGAQTLAGNDVRRKPDKLRVTTHQKTGEVLAKIIKLRVQDINVYSPSTAFDYRISVNLEVGFDGSIEDATVDATTAKERAPDRYKDRLSYRHQAYQVDLTQVSDAAKGRGGEKTHELEIEMSSAEIRRQGKLLLAGKPNEIERLVKVFLDNVKILARAAGPRSSA